VCHRRCVMTILIDPLTHLPVLTDDGLVSTVTYCSAEIGEDHRVTSRPLTCRECQSFLAYWQSLIGQTVEGQKR